MTDTPVSDELVERVAAAIGRCGNSGAYPYEAAARAALSASRVRELVERLKEIRTAVTFAAPSKLFNGVECYEARVPIEFVEGIDATLAKVRNQ